MRVGGHKLQVHKARVLKPCAREGEDGKVSISVSFKNPVCPLNSDNINIQIKCVGPF
jgi:hypothetical protein